jgi:hypothetical protein
MFDTEQICCSSPLLAPLYSTHSSFSHLQTAMANNSVGDYSLDTALVDSSMFARCVARLSDLRVNHLMTSSSAARRVSGILQLYAPMFGAEMQISGACCDLPPQPGASYVTYRQGGDRATVVARSGMHLQRDA